MIPLEQIKQWIHDGKRVTRTDVTYWGVYVRAGEELIDNAEDIATEIVTSDDLITIDYEDANGDYTVEVTGVKSNDPI